MVLPVALFRLCNYDTKIDYAIAFILYRQPSLGYRQLFRLITSCKYLNREMSFETFDIHIKNMVKNNQLIKYTLGWKRGKRKPLSLSDSARQEISLKMFEVTSPSHTHVFDNKSQIKSRAYQLILFLCADRYVKLFNSQGISIESILSFHKSGYPFAYMRYPKTTLKECIKLLLKEKVIRVIDGEGVRYDLSDESIRHFVIEYWKLYEVVSLRMVLTWKWVRRQRSFEREWYEFMKGEYKATKHLNTIRQLRYQFKNQYEKTKYYRILRNNKTTIRAQDAFIDEQMKLLQIKYRPLMNKYPSLTRYLRNLIVPQWLIQDRSKSKAFTPKLLLHVSTSPVVVS